MKFEVSTLLLALSEILESQKLSVLDSFMGMCSCPFDDIRVIRQLFSHFNFSNHLLESLDIEIMILLKMLIQIIFVSLRDPRLIKMVFQAWKLLSDIFKSHNNVIPSATLDS